MKSIIFLSSVAVLAGASSCGECADGYECTADWLLASGKFYCYVPADSECADKDGSDATGFYSYDVCKDYVVPPPIDVPFNPNAVDLPRCKCSQAWPNGDNKEVWENTMNFGDPDNWAIAAPTGCQCAGGDCVFMFCVPDMSKGPCVAWANWAPSVEQYFMQCGSEAPLAANDPNFVLTEPMVDTYAPMTPKEVGGAMAMFDYVKTAPAHVGCECADAATTADSKLRELYCGPSSKGYADGTTFNKSTCVTSPSVFHGDGDGGSIQYGYPTKEFMQSTPVDEWCVVDPALAAKHCSKNAGGVDKCTGETWMKSPNLIDSNSQFKGVVSNAIFWGEHLGFNSALIAGYAPFFPSVLVGDGTETPSELHAKYAVAHDDIYATKDKLNYDALLGCDDACMEKNAAVAAKDEADRAALIIQLFDECTANTKCKATRDATTSCAALTRTTDSALNPTGSLCPPHFYFSQNSNMCMNPKQAGEYCNIVQTCDEGLTCTAGKCEAHTC